ncbi:MAG: hypothetical protein K0V04_17495 [Deltaproteobacteria bacterium]|nr:hypothetical protein [Deltaproteobacteria bacterium]
MLQTYTLNTIGRMLGALCLLGSSSLSGCSLAEHDSVELRAGQATTLSTTRGGEVVIRPLVGEIPCEDPEQEPTQEVETWPVAFQIAWEKGLVDLTAIWELTVDKMIQEVAPTCDDLCAENGLMFTGLFELEPKFVILGPPKFDLDCKEDEKSSITKAEVEVELATNIDCECSVFQ